jgi:hypothetical protein
MRTGRNACVARADPYRSKLAKVMPELVQEASVFEHRGADRPPIAAAGVICARSPSRQT